MPSKVDVANTALDRLGQPAIVSFGDGTKTANLVSRMWPIVRDQVHRAGCWRRLKARAQLAADTTAPEFDYTYRFRLPAECLMILDIFINAYPLNSRWELEGEYILSDESGPLQLRYIKDSDDPNKWDALHISAVAWLLAAEMCEALNQSSEKRGQAFAAFQRIAKAVEPAGQDPARKLAFRHLQPHVRTGVAKAGHGVAMAREDDPFTPHGFKQHRPIRQAGKVQRVVPGPAQRIGER